MWKGQQKDQYDEKALIDWNYLSFIGIKAWSQIKHLF